MFLSFLFILYPAPLPHLIVLGAVSKSTFPMPHHLAHNHLRPAHIPSGNHITMHTMHVQTLQRLSVSISLYHYPLPPSIPACIQQHAYIPI
jgi:hypothetical protein